MAVWTHLQGTGANSGSKTTSVSKAFAGSVAVGSLVVVGVANLDVDGHTVDTMAVTDSKGNTYTRTVSHVFSVGAFQYLDVWYTVVVTGGSSFTVTLTPQHAGFCNISIDEYNLAGTLVSAESTSFDNIGGAPSATPSSGNLTVTATDLIYGIASQSNNVSGNPFAAGSGFNARWTENFVPGVAVGVSAEDQLDVTTSPIPATWTLAASVTWQAAAVAFKATAAAAFPPFPAALLPQM